MQHLSDIFTKFYQKNIITTKLYHYLMDIIKREADEETIDKELADFIEGNDFPFDSVRAELVAAAALDYFEESAAVFTRKYYPEVTNPYKDGDTMLHFAVRLNNLPFVQYCVKYAKALGIDVYAKNNEGISSRRLALNLGHFDCLNVIAQSQVKRNDAPEITRLRQMLIVGQCTLKQKGNDEYFSEEEEGQDLTKEIARLKLTN